MSLVKNILVQQLTMFVDMESPTFVDFPVSWEDAASKWANAVNVYAASVVPVSTTSAVAMNAFMTSFLSKESVPMDQRDMTVLTDPLMQYAIALATGMVPAFTGTPPPLNCDLQPVYEMGVNGASASDCIDMMCTIIDAWFRTGVAVNVATGASVVWS